MSKIKNRGLDQYGAEPFEQQQFGTAGIERVKLPTEALPLDISMEQTPYCRVQNVQTHKVKVFLEHCTNFR